MLKKVVTAVALVSAFGMVSSSAMAAKPLDSGFYVDGNLGWGTSSAVSDFNDSTGGSCNSPGVSCSKSSFAWGLGAGYQFMPNLAVDFDYLRTQVFKQTYQGETDTDHMNSFVLSAKGILPVGDGFSIYGKIGPAIQDLSVTGSSIGTKSSDSNSVVTLYLGLGAQYNITSNFYVGVLGSYFMKRGNLELCNGGVDVCANNYSPQMWDITANIGYMF